MPGGGALVSPVGRTASKKPSGRNFTASTTLLEAGAFSDGRVSNEMRASSAQGRKKRTAQPPSTGCGPRKLKRSEEHTSELQSHSDLVCRLLLEKKKKNKK